MIVCAAGPIATVCVTCGAAEKLVFPTWSAAITQLPAVTIVTVVPETVHTPVDSDEYVGVRPELAVASGLIANVPDGTNVCDACAPNVMVCAAGPMATVCVTCGAAEKFVFPAWSAAMTQLPAVTIVTVVPETVQTPVDSDEYVGVRPELAVASGLIANVPEGTNV